MKVGITLPTFEPTAAAALATARAAEGAGIDGVFVFDHLWRGARRSRPALSMYTVLAAVATGTRRIRLGSLVARVGFLPDRLIAESFFSLQELCGHRLVAALGIGDAKSVSENEAYGIAWPAVAERRAAAPKASKPGRSPATILPNGPTASATSRRWSIRRSISPTRSC